MILLIDIGNSRLKAGIAASEQITSVAPIAWRERAPAVWDELLGVMPTPSRVLVSNVAGAVIAASLTAHSVQRWQLTPQFVQVQTEFAGMRTRYVQPSQLGIDRWLAALAGFTMTGAAVGVIDAGTALTVDVVTTEGEHRGGLIAPGLGLMARSLTAGTAQLNIDSVSAVERFATNTQAAISLGCREAFAGLLTRVGERWRNEIGDTPTWFATGGESGLVCELSPYPVREVPDLVLRGLRIVAEHSQ
ncbi:MAG: type III pantothenate kinase [Gammaproteobacteria bacterium]|nr:type III pantothenate kinase [Gammaproteobacteria bacterium]